MLWSFGPHISLQLNSRYSGIPVQTNPRQMKFKHDIYVDESIGSVLADSYFLSLASVQGTGIYFFAHQETMFKSNWMIIMYSH